MIELISEYWHTEKMVSAKPQRNKWNGKAWLYTYDRAEQHRQVQSGGVDTAIELLTISREKWLRTGLGK